MLLSAAKLTLRPLLITALLATSLAAQADTLPTWNLLHGKQTLTVNAGDSASGVRAYDESHVTVLDGQLSSVSFYDNATGSIQGGDIAWLRVGGNSSVRITGIEDLSWLVFEEGTPLVEIVANDVSFSQGHLSGTWGNGQSFSFWAINMSEVLEGGVSTLTMPAGLTVTAVPEPQSYAMFMMGCAVMLGAAARKRRALRGA